MHATSGSSTRKSVAQQRKGEAAMQSTAIQKHLPLGVLCAIAALTLWRVALLFWSDADLFVDESQYWLWGQELDWGYYSKPPLVGWVIRAVTDLVGSSAEAFVRLPAPLLHGVTALLLWGTARRLAPGAAAQPAAALVALAYITLPMVALGSFLISTDTILLPFWVSGLWLALVYRDRRRAQQPAAPVAFALGLCLGAGMMAKYAAIYFVIGAGLVALLQPAARVRPRDLGLAALGFGLMLAPNVVWNLQNDLATLSHTADNVDWLKDSAGVSLHPDRLLEFLASQLAVMGPVLFPAYLWAVVVALRSGGAVQSWAVALSLPVLVLVCLQALLSKAYANWAAMTYPAALLLVVPYLWARARGVLALALAVNIGLSLVVGLASVRVTQWERDETLLLKRYTGRAQMVEAALALAQREGLSGIVADSRDVLGDLFYYAHDSGLALFAAPQDGPPRHYYAQKHAFGRDRGAEAMGEFLYIGSRSPCARAILLGPLNVARGEYRDARLTAFKIDISCWEDPE